MLALDTAFTEIKKGLCLKRKVEIKCGHKTTKTQLKHLRKNIYAVN